MADEITITASMALVNGTLKPSLAPAAYTVTQNTAFATGHGQTIGTTEEALVLTDITTEGWFMMQNHDATNYVEWGFSTGVYGGRMKASESAGPFRLNPGATLYLKANTAACLVEALALDD